MQSFVVWVTLVFVQIKFSFKAKLKGTVIWKKSKEFYLNNYQ